MASTPTRLMTVEAFRQLPEDKGPVYHELRHGEVVAVTRPKFKHYLIQRKLRDFLQKLAPPDSCVDIEMAFRPLPEYELWCADIAYLSAERYQNVDPEDNIRGAPELVIEILSPSNTAAEIMDKEQICLSNGAQEFWLVDPKKRRVRISTARGISKTYESGQEIPLSLFGTAILPVDAIFE